MKLLRLWTISHRRVKVDGRTSRRRVRQPTLTVASVFMTPDIALALPGVDTLLPLETDHPDGHQLSGAVSIREQPLRGSFTPTAALFKRSSVLGDDVPELPSPLFPPGPSSDKARLALLDVARQCPPLVKVRVQSDESPFHPSGP